MLRITIEMLKGGRRAKPETLYVGYITLINWNQSKPRGGDRVELKDKSGRGWKQAIVKNFPRKRLLAWDLLQQCLNAALGDKR